MTKGTNMKLWLKANKDSVKVKSAKVFTLQLPEIIRIVTTIRKILQKFSLNIKYDHANSSSSSSNEVSINYYYDITGNIDNLNEDESDMLKNSIIELGKNNVLIWASLKKAQVHIDCMYQLPTII